MKNVSNSSEMTDNKKTFALPFECHVQSRDLHAIRFRLGIDTQISQESDMATDPVRLKSLHRNTSTDYVHIGLVQSVRLLFASLSDHNAVWELGISRTANAMWHLHEK